MDTSAKKQSILHTLDINIRICVTFIAMLIIWVVLDILSDGIFITPRNLWNLSVQTSVVGIMSCAMVLIIVTRNIDLSIGSLLGFVGMLMAFTQVYVFEIGSGHNWILSILIGLGAGTLIGGVQGAIVAYGRIPSFIVTLGGLLIFRGLAWMVTSGQTLAPMEEKFQIFGGGLNGSIGDFWSRVLGIAAAVYFIGNAVYRRNIKTKLGMKVRPMWAEFMLIITVTASIAIFVETLNAFPLPESMTNGEFVSRGIAVPVVIMIASGFIMSIVAKKTRFGRYCFAIGGNPEAADLVGINTKRTIVYTFAVMGFFAALAAVVATARLNSGLNSTGTLAELSVISAAVIGGTSLNGGSGTILGALLGAVIMQSLQSGMVLLDMPTPMQNVVIGIGLILAVWFDSMFQKKR